MEIKKGIGVSPNVAIGEALVMESDEKPIMRRFFPTEELESELARFDHALSVAREEIAGLAQQVTDTIGEQYGGIFQAHLRMLEDETLTNQVRALIKEKNFTAEYAVSRIIRKYMKRFRKIEDPYLAERVRDLGDIEHRLLRALSGEEQREQFRAKAGPMVLIAHDLTTAQAATLDTEKVLGFATDLGGRTSHTAIVAKGFEHPGRRGHGNDHRGRGHRRHRDRGRHARTGDRQSGRSHPATLPGHARALPPGGGGSQEDPHRTRGHHRRGRGDAHGQYRVSAGSGTSRGQRRRGRGPVPHGVPLPRPQHRPFRRGPLRPPTPTPSSSWGSDR